MRQKIKTITSHAFIHSFTLSLSLSLSLHWLYRCVTQKSIRQMKHCKEHKVLFWKRYLLYSIYFSFKSEYLGYAYVRVSRQDCLILWWPFNNLHIVIRADGSDTTMSDEGRSRALDPWKLTLFSLVNLKQYHR